MSEPHKVIRGPEDAGDWVRAAKDPATSSYVLAQIWRMSLGHLHTLVLKNPNTPVELLAQSAALREVWENPAWELALLADPGLGARALDKALMPGIAQHPPPLPDLPLWLGSFRAAFPRWSVRDQEALLEYWAGQGLWPGKERLLHMKNRALGARVREQPLRRQREVAYLEQLERGELGPKEASHRPAVCKAHGMLIQHAQTGTYSLLCVTQHGSSDAWLAAVREWLVG